MCNKQNGIAWSNDYYFPENTIKNVFCDIC